MTDYIIEDVNIAYVSYFYRVRAKDKATAYDLFVSGVAEQVDTEIGAGIDHEETIIEEAPIV